MRTTHLRSAVYLLKSDPPNVTGLHARTPARRCVEMSTSGQHKRRRVMDIECKRSRFSACINLAEALCFRAEHQPDKLAYRFLLDGEREAASISYSELDRRARSVGAWLQQVCESGRPVLLLYPPGLEFIATLFGCLYAGMIAVPTYPPHPGRHSLRLRAIVDSAKPAVALASRELIPAVGSVLEEASRGPSLQCFDIDRICGLRQGGGDGNEPVGDGLADRWRRPATSGDHVAMIQYTSGSTGTPNGVALTDANLMHNSQHIRRCFGHTAESRGLIWLPPYHDMGLIGGILQPLYAGFPVTLMSPLHFLQQPIRWLQAISQTRATTSGGPNFAYDLCVEKTSSKERAALDLSSWEVAFTGAEPIRAETLDRFAAVFESCGFRRDAFYPCYGLAEATLIVSGGAKQSPPVVREVPAEAKSLRRVVGCGRSLFDQEVVVVDPERLTRCGPNEVGEIWVRGPSVAQGYWNRPEQTRAAFDAFLADQAAGPYLRTGDLGFLRDGELFITGRLKDLLIVGGRNHYPQDIEQTVQQCHPAIRAGCCAAFSIEHDGEERLVVVAELQRLYVPRHSNRTAPHRATENGVAVAVEPAETTAQSQLPEITQAIRCAVAQQHELRVFDVRFLKPATMAKTSSGKLQRQACRAQYLAETLSITR